MSNFSTRTPSMSIRYALPGLIAILIIIAVGLTGALAFRSGRESVNELAETLSREITIRIEDKVKAFLDVPFLLQEVTQASIDAGTLDIQDYEQLEPYFWHQVNISESVPYFFFASETDDFVGVDSIYGEAGETVFKLRDAESAPFRVTYAVDENGNRGEEIERREYFPTQRSWYINSAEARQPMWTDVYVSFSSQNLVISAAAPVEDENGEFLGILGIDLTLEEISNFMRELQIGQNGQALIIEHSGNIIATSTDELPYVTVVDDEGAEEQEPKSILASEDEIVQAIVDYLVTERSDQVQIAEDEEGNETISFDFDANEPIIDVEIDGELYYLQVSPLTDERNLDWIIMVVVPENDFMGPVRQTVRNTAYIGGAVLIVASVLGFVTARWIIQPLVVISDVAEAIEDGNYDLDPLGQVTGRTDELGRLARIFKIMGEEVYAREQKLKQEIQSLRIEIDTQKRDMQVTDITESEFFTDLQQRATDMRRRGRRRGETDEEIPDEQ